jgi:hypothetical protein
MSRTLPKCNTLSDSTLRVASSLAHNYKSRVKVAGSDQPYHHKNVSKNVYVQFWGAKRVPEAQSKESLIRLYSIC